MKNQTRIILWVTALLLVVAGCFTYFYHKATEVGISNKDIEILHCKPEEIVEYHVSDKDGEYILKKEKDNWIIKNQDIPDLDEKAVNKLMYSASDIKAVGSINKKKLSEFNTNDACMLEINLIRLNGKKESIKIRFLGTSNELAAFSVENDSEIYVMRHSMFDILTPNLSDLRNSYIFGSFKESETLPDYFRYTDYDGSEIIVRKKTADELARNKNNQFIMDSPYKKEVDDEKFEQQIVVKIPAIQTNEFVKQPNNLEGMGLDDKSRAELTFVWNNETKTLYLGKNTGGFVFAKLKDTDGVFKINPSYLEILQIDPFFILESSLLKSSPENIQSVIVKANGATYNLTSIDRNDESPRFYCNGKTASEDVFEKILEQLEEIEIISEVASSPSKTEDVVVIINYNDAAGSQTISLSLMNDKNYAVFADKKPEFAVSGKAVDDLLAELKKANNNPMKVD